MQASTLFESTSFWLGLIGPIVSMIVLVLGCYTSFRVNRIETEIKQSEHYWRKLEKRRREYSAKLQALLMLRKFEQEIIARGYKGRRSLFDSLANPLKSLVDEYGDTIPTITDLYVNLATKISDPVLWGACPEEMVDSLMSDITEEIEFLEESTDKLRQEIEL